MRFNSMTKRGGKRVLPLGALVIASAVAITGCSPSTVAPEDDGVETPVFELGISDADYSLDALIAAAKDEAPITVLDTTGKIVDIAENFTAKYGVQATGVKVTGVQQSEMAVRESQANNIQSDVLFMVDAPTAAAQLIPQGIVTSWMPPDLKDVVPEQFQNPVAVTQEPLMWAYNTDAFDSCPVDNIWALTTDQWAGKVTYRDPLLNNEFTNWFNQMDDHGNDQIAAAYESQFGKTLDTSSTSAAKQWVQAMAGNDPLVVKVGEDSADTIGAPGQSAADSFIGYVTAAKFRDNEEKGYKLGLCKDVEPWVGHAYVKLAVIATATKSPNAAKLFVHYMLTNDGIGPQVADGKKSTNSEIPLPADEPSGIDSVWDQMLILDSSTAANDYVQTPEWQDLWTIASR